jgi:segregation and condensation protein A
VNTLTAIDPNVAGEFLVMAAVLMEIKSRMLLPRPVAVEGDAEDLSDPRLELVRQLLEYKKFKDASLELGASAQAAALRWPRGPAALEPAKPGAVDLEQVQIWDLVAVFNRLMASIGESAATHDVVFDDTPIALHAADILDRMQAEGGALGFEDVFVGRTKVEMIGLFLALLELMRQKRVTVTQSGMFGTIRIVLLSAEPIEIGEEWSPTLREAIESPVVGGGDDQSRSRLPLMSPGDVKGEGAPSGADNRETSASDDADELEGFAELDRIKTEVDIDLILKDPVQEEKPQIAQIIADKRRDL